MKDIQWVQKTLFNTGKWIDISEVIIKIILIFIIAQIVIRFARSVINKIFDFRFKTKLLRYNERKEITLKKLCLSIVMYVVYFIVLITSLEAIGINMKALLAGISVAGFITGLGAQNLIKDILNGFFILFEDQFSVGDHVSINDTKGTVEEIGLRTTKIRGVDGEFYFFANSNITKVANYTLGEIPEIHTPEQIKTREE
ncbi:mechanosensitive ion channel family protein [Priestia aryabhattai]|uniref:mechanosensitive ion channel family protein n=1 Tax=Priestia aryabhattai TaxID=412384 RepID=UPI0015F3C62B|nr:mechanosensitive ion channel domain-containing protein [Priestia aryabhattai]